MARPTAGSEPKSPRIHGNPRQSPRVQALMPELERDSGDARRFAVTGSQRRAGTSSDGASRTRTGDLLGAIQALSQLSYSPVRASRPEGRSPMVAGDRGSFPVLFGT